MPIYEVRLTKTVTDCLGVTVTIEADTAAEAAAKALVDADGLDFQYIGEVDSDAPEVTEVTVVND